MTEQSIKCGQHMACEHNYGDGTVIKMQGANADGGWGFSGCGIELKPTLQYRCLDCGVAFCKVCLQKHCRHDLQEAQGLLRETMNHLRWLEKLPPRVKIDLVAGDDAGELADRIEKLIKEQK